MTLAPDASLKLRMVFVRGLEVQAFLGVHAHEKKAPQKVVISVELAVRDDSAPHGVGPDDLGRVVDYQGIVHAIRNEASSGHVYLVETLAERIAVGALKDDRVRRVRVMVEKPDAFKDVAAVGVVVERAADSF